MKKLLALSILPILTACWTIGTGEKVGKITKINHEGLFCKTWEVQIIRGGMNDGSGSFGAPFNFTVESEDLVKKVQKALDEQREVKIKYHQEFATLCRTEGYRNDNDGWNYFLDDISFIELSTTK